MARVDPAGDAPSAEQRTAVDVSAQLDAQGRLRSIVWRGPSIDDFDQAVDGAMDRLRRAAAAVGAFGVRLRREERVA